MAFSFLPDVSTYPLLADCYSQKLVSGRAQDFLPFCISLPSHHYCDERHS